MSETSKSKAELLEEIVVLRRRIEQLQISNQRSLVSMESDGNLQALFDNIPDGILVANAETHKFHKANKKMCHMLGCQEHEIRQLAVTDIHPAEAIPRVLDHFNKQARGEMNVAPDIPVKRKDDTIFYADVNAFPIHLDGREYVAGVFRDVTERRCLESRLRNSEAALRAILDATTESVLLVDPDMKIVAINKMSAQRFGGSPEEMIGRDVSTLLRKTMPTKIAEARLARLQAVFDSGQPVTFEDNREQWFFESSLFPVFDDSGNVSAVAIFARDITDQKRTIEQLRAGEATMKAILDATTESVFLIDTNKRILSLNKTAAERLGMSDQDLVGANLEQLLRQAMPPEAVDDRIAYGDRVMQSGKPLRMEDQREGRTFDTNMYPVFDAAGNVTSMVVFARDITEQKKAQQALEESEAWYRSLIELGTTVYAVLDPDGTIRYESPTLKRVYGWEPGEVVGKNILELVHPDDVEYAGQRLARLLKRPGDVEEAEVRYRHKDGSWLTIAVSGVNLMDEPAIKGIVLTSHNITRRKELEDAIIQNEQKYRTLVESAGETIAAIDVDGVFHFVNTVGAERLGTTPEQMIGKNMWDFFPMQIADQQVQVVRAVVNSAQGRTIRSLTDIQGEKRWYNTTIEPITEADGTTQAALIIARDIHSIELAELELAELRQRMARAERFACMGIIGATLSHRVTQPLTAITLSIENTLAELEATETPEPVTRFLKRGLDGASQIGSIVDNLRALARSSEESTKEPVDLGSLVDEVVRLLTQPALSANVSLNVLNVDKLPPILASRFEIEQVFFALVQNAIQAADGEQEHNVTISGSSTDDQVELRFSDDCRGIAPEDFDRVFEPFFTTKAIGTETGLGLCVAEYIVKRAGGDISLESHLGKGTTFIVTLPVTRQNKH